MYVGHGTGPYASSVIGMKVKIFTTGGTIDKIYFDAKSAYAVGQPQIEGILTNVHAQIEYEIEGLFQKDSLEITDADREYIAGRVADESCHRVLITHGTDTMVETARLLEKIENKVIVLVGSLSPARFKESDAEFNIGFALGALQALPPGAYVAMNGRVFRSDEVRKNRAANRFEMI